MREVRHIDSITEYLLDRKYHRSNGPAIVWDGDGYGGWWLFGNRHRYYGPRADYESWYIHGDCIKN